VQARAAALAFLICSRLQNDLNEAAVASAEMQRLMLEKATSDKREYIRFLDQKLTAADKLSSAVEGRPLSRNSGAGQPAKGTGE